MPPANGVWPPSGQVKFSAPLSVVKTRMRLVGDADVFQLLHHRADDVVELGHPRLVGVPAVLGRLQLGIFFERWVMMCIRVGFSQVKNGLSSAFALSMNLKVRSRISSSTVFIRSG